MSKCKVIGHKRGCKYKITNLILKPLTEHHLTVFIKQCVGDPFSKYPIIMNWSSYFKHKVHYGPHEFIRKP